MLPNIKLTHFTLKHLHTNKGVSLIIVIFAMMLFAVLGWTLAILQSTDFEANLRTLDSERALGLAEAGANWALRQLATSSSWRTSATPDSDCDGADDWRTHGLSPGQYRICCRNPCTSPPCGSVTVTEAGDAVIESEGYIPQTGNYRSMREVKLVVSLGSLTRAVQTPPEDALSPQQGLFNWWLVRQGNHSISIEGDIYAGYYEGDGDDIYDEEYVGVGDIDDFDFSRPPYTLLPPGSGRRDIDEDIIINFPSISMLWFYNNTAASRRWPSPSDTQIQAIAELRWIGPNQYLEVPPSLTDFFTGMVDQVVRRASVSDWWQGDGQQGNSNWRVILDVTLNGRRALLYPGSGTQAVTWPDEDPDPSNPGTQVNIKLVKRFYQSSPFTPDGIWYIGGEVVTGNPVNRADTLIDVRSDNVDLRDTYIISEGDIAIKGSNQLLIRFTGPAATPRHPTLATRNGSIISTDSVVGIDRRRITGLIYSESGHINLNYLGYPTTGTEAFRGNLVYGYRITLDGDIQIRYRPAVGPSGGFIFRPSVITWQEQ